MGSTSFSSKRLFVALFCGFLFNLVSAQSDISTLVNPSTGDFSYGIPVLEVPGPEGGFTINLGYAAGIRNEQQGSWVGLGWSLEGGAITRSVVGFPDDYNGGEVVIQQTDPGGRHTYDAPVGLKADPS